MIKPTLKSTTQLVLQSNKEVATPVSQGHCSSPPASSDVTRHGDIAQRAYDIYVQNGHQEGQSEQNWRQAEKDLSRQGPVSCQKEHHRKEVFAPDSVGAK